MSKTPYRAVLLLGPGSPWPENIKELYDREDCLVIGDGTREITSDELTEKLKGRTNSHTRVDIGAHGNVDPDSKQHRVSLCAGHGSTAETLNALGVIIGVPFQCHLWSCYGGAAAKDVISLPIGSCVVAHATDTDSIIIQGGMDSIRASVSAYLAMPTASEIVLDYQEILDHLALGSGQNMYFAINNGAEEPVVLKDRLALSIAHHVEDGLPDFDTMKLAMQSTYSQAYDFVHEYIGGSSIVGVKLPTIPKKSEVTMDELETYYTSMLSNRVFLHPETAWDVILKYDTPCHLSAIGRLGRLSRLWGDITAHQCSIAIEHLSMHMKEKEVLAALYMLKDKPVQFNQILKKYVDKLSSKSVLGLIAATKEYPEQLKSIIQSGANKLNVADALQALVVIQGEALEFNELLDACADKFTLSEVKLISGAVRHNPDRLKDVFEKCIGHLKSDLATKILIKRKCDDLRFERMLTRCANKLTGDQVADVLIGVEHDTSKFQLTLEKVGGKMHGPSFAGMLNVVKDNDVLFNAVLEKGYRKLTGSEISMLLGEVVDNPLQFDTVLEKCGDKMNGEDITNMLFLTTSPEQTEAVLKKCVTTLSAEDVSFMISDIDNKEHLAMIRIICAEQLSVLHARRDTLARVDCIRGVADNAVKSETGSEFLSHVEKLKQQRISKARLDRVR